LLKKSKVEFESKPLLGLQRKGRKTNWTQSGGGGVAAHRLGKKKGKSQEAAGCGRDCGRRKKGGKPVIRRHRLPQSVDGGGRENRKGEDQIDFG